MSKYIKKTRRTAQERFWEKVDKNGPVPQHMQHLGSCWIWTRSLIGGGYGCFNIARHKTWYAHRFSYSLLVGEIPKDMQCLHRCDNRKCVNPLHLFLGTNSDNVADKIAKGRNNHMKGPAWSEFIRQNQPRGESAATAKLSESDVLKIRALYKYGSHDFGTIALARQFGIGCSYVSAIVHRRNWKHV